MADIVPTARDISCGHSSRTITRALKPIERLHEVTVDIPTRQVGVEYNETWMTANKLEEISKTRSTRSSRPHSQMLARTERIRSVRANVVTTVFS